MGLTISDQTVINDGPARIRLAKVTFDSSYPTGGEAITAALFGLNDLTQVVPLGAPSGYSFEHDKTNATLKAFASTPIQTVAVKDADGAAAAGVAVYVHIDEVLEQGTALAHLEFVSPTNADGTGTISNGGATYFIQDDDAAATGGVAIYLDEDATIGSRLLANTGRDCFVMLSNGEFLKITHNATPGTPGVLVYFDEDAAASYDRLQFVSPTNANGTAHTSLNLTMRRATGEVVDTTDLSAVSVWVLAIGH